MTDRSLLLGESLTASYRTSIRRRNLSPEEGISLWEHLMFSWPKKLLRQGTRCGIATPDQRQSWEILRKKFYDKERVYF